MRALICSFSASGIGAEEAAGAASASTPVASWGVGEEPSGRGRGGLGVDAGVVVGGRRGGPTHAEVVLEVDGDGLADLLFDGGLGDEAEDSEGVAGAVGAVGEGGLGLATRGGGRGEGKKLVIFLATTGPPTNEEEAMEEYKTHEKPTPVKTTALGEIF
ncbi:hypothetical protein NL676_026536 [Syzygium grande]|nr:hypothetical protein NL676_026536 [Syzygium grande]